MRLARGIGRRWLLAAAALTGMAMASPAQAEWIEARSPHFIVYGDMTESALKARVARLERFDAALRGLFKVEGADMTTIYITHGLAEMRGLTGRDDVAGFYRGSAQGAVAFIPDSAGSTPFSLSADNVMFHEYTHHILLSNEQAVYPGWVTEGLAELFASPHFEDDGGIVFGQTIDNRGWAMNGMNRWSVKRLLMSDIERPKPDEVIELYSRGWLLCDYLLFSGKRQGQLFAYIAALNKGQAPLDAAKAVFGDLGKLDDEVESFKLRGKLPGKKLNADQIKAPTQIALRKMTAGEAAIMPYRMVSVAGVTLAGARHYAARVHPLVDRFTDDAFVQNSLAEMDFDAGDYDRADAEAARALVLDPANAMAMVFRGRVAGMRAVAASGPQAETLWKEARGWILKANRAAPESAFPFVLFYDSFLAAGQPVPEAAKTGLRAALVVAPADASVRLRIVAMCLREGQTERARQYLAAMATDPHSDNRDAVVKLLQGINAGDDKDTLLARMHELKLEGDSYFTPPKPEGKKKPG